MSDPVRAMKYRDLTFQKAQISNTRKEFERVHLGSRTPSKSELSALAKEFAKQARDLHLLYVGITSIDGAPVDSATQECNAIVLLFTDKKSLRNFLNQPVAPSMSGITLVVDVTSPPRL
jgi:hypothetical protein